MLSNAINVCDLVYIAAFSEFLRDVSDTPFAVQSPPLPIKIVSTYLFAQTRLGRKVMHTIHFYKMQQLRTGAGHGSRPREGNRQFGIGQLLQKAARVRRDGGASRDRGGNSALQRLLQGSRRVSYYVHCEIIRGIH